MRRSLPGEHLVFGCAASIQAVLQFKTKGEITLPYGFRYVTELGGGVQDYLGYVIESGTRIVVAFRGTENLIDLITDFNLGQVPYPYLQGAGFTHRGFTELYERAIRPRLHETLGKLSARKRLFLAGHSLGGALAALAALDLSAGSRFRRPSVYTYGSPKVGNADFVTAYDNKIIDSWRVINTNDVIAGFPPANGNGAYAHVGTKVPVTFQAGSLLRNHQIRYYADALADIYPLAGENLRKRSPGFLPVTDSAGGVISGRF